MILLKIKFPNSLKSKENCVKKKFTLIIYIEIYNQTATVGYPAWHLAQPYLVPYIAVAYI